jgi:RND family efflux transporter MFP subunit
MRSLRYILLAVALVSCKRKEPEAPPQMPPPAVGVIKIVAEPIIEWEEFSSRVEAVESVSLSPRVSGYLDAVKFSAGEMVNKEQVLFQIDPLPYQAKHAQTAALLERAEAALATARSESERVPELLLARAMTKEEADARLSNYQQAQSSFAAAAADHQLAQLDLDRTKVTSPIAGRISRAMVTAGNPVNPATVLTTIVSVDPVHAYADLDENTLLRVQELIAKKQVKLDDEGRIPVQLQLADETEFPHTGWFESLDNRVIASTGSIVLRAIIPNPDGKLLPGMFARIRLPLSAEKPTIVLSETAIKTDQGQKFVYVIDEKSLAQYRPVVLGPVMGQRRIIRSGLKEGDVVVVNGLAKIFMPGMPVVAEYEKLSTP